VNFTALNRSAALLAFLAPLAAAADLPSGEDLLRTFIERSGGAEAYARAKSVEMTGRVEIAGRNIGGKVSMIEEGKKSWTAMELPGIGTIEMGSDGDTAWENSALQGPRIVEGEEKSAMERSSSFSLVTSWREQYKTIRTAGEETVDGKAAWKVEMTPKEGNVENFDFDKDSGLLVRIAMVMSSPLGEIPTDMTFSDYRMVDGIRTPFITTQNAMGQKIVMTFDKIVYNAPVAAGRFDLPDAVKAVLAKRPPK
jgi:hypothetical protein